jgi:ribonuclease D
VDLAVRQPGRIDELRPLRRLHPREIERSGRAILAEVRRGLAVPEDELPERPIVHRDEPERALLVDLMAVVLRKRARENRIATTYLGNQKALSHLVDWLSGSRDGGTPQLLEGWRGELVGSELTALFEGKVRLGVDPKTGRVITE